VAYDDKTTYPFGGTLRNYKNAKFFGANPTRDLRDAPVIIGTGQLWQSGANRRPGIYPV
jgi:hypothetical protein